MPLGFFFLFSPLCFSNNSVALSVDRIEERTSEKSDHWRIAVNTYILMFKISSYKVFSANSSWKPIFFFQRTKTSPHSCPHKTGIFFFVKCSPSAWAGLAFPSPLAGRSNASLQHHHRLLKAFPALGTNTEKPGEGWPCNDAALSRTSPVFASCNLPSVGSNAKSADKHSWQTSHS